MTTLYIANTSKSNHDFSFRRGEDQIPRVIKIIAGTQAPVLKDGSVEEVDAIIAQHRKYGLKPVEEAAKSKNYVGLCYSVDRPMTFKDMKIVFNHNDVALKKEGETRLEEIAAAANATIDQGLEARGIPSAAAHVELEVREERPVGETPTLAIGKTVVKDPPEGGGERRQGGRRGGASRRK